jgi:hypothetical protein
MAKESIETEWLAVIGRCLAYLCLEEAKRREPAKFNTVPKKVEFLRGMGLPKDAAAYAAGSTPASVAELERQQRNRKGNPRCPT